MTTGNELEEESDVRALLESRIPDFLTTPALADRALAGAVKRRRQTRVLGGAGAVTALAVGALAVGPLAGWGGGRGSGSGDVSAASAGAGPTTHWVETPKDRAVDRVSNALHSGHLTSFMGAGLSGTDYSGGSPMPGADTDQSPIVVYRKPTGDPTLVADAVAAAKPYAVVFKDSVLNASEQWVLGQRINRDLAYWHTQGVTIGTALEFDGTITIFSPDPDKALPLLEAHYGYDGRVFVGRKEDFTMDLPSPGAPTSVPDGSMPATPWKTPDASTSQPGMSSGH